MKRILNNYIRMLIESIEDDNESVDDTTESDMTVNNDLTSLQDRYSDIIAAKDLEYSKQPTWKDIEKLKKKNIAKSPWTSGWNELKRITKFLTMAIDNNKQYLDNKEQLIQICFNVMKNLDYQKIGEGANRVVFSRNDVDFVIKIEKNRNSLNYNFHEVNNYINHTNKNIYPKILGYDQSNVNDLDQDPQRVMWLIMEKVKPIAMRSADKQTQTITTFFNLEDIFPLFCSELNTVLDYMQDSMNNEVIIQLKDEIKNKSSFYWDVISMLMVESNKSFKADQRIPKDGSEFKLRYMKYRPTENIMPIADAVANLSNSISDKDSFIDLFIQTCQQFNLFRIIPADLMYVYNAFSDVIYEDMHIMNLGIKEKEMKENPNEPWKALCILDYAEDATEDWTQLQMNQKNNLF